MENNLLRKIIFNLEDFFLPKANGLEAERIVSKMLEKQEPCMIARLGAVESKALLYDKLPYPINLLLKKYLKNHLHQNAGFFPINEESVHKFAALMRKSMCDCDILGSWRPEELLFQKELKQAQRITLGTIGGPHDHPDTWTAQLKEKDILVVHPFAETIKKQYDEKRSKLFNCEYVLPEFKSLQVIKAVQTVAGNHQGFSSWFEALSYMEKEISNCSFDICLIGCGAYGFPLAAYVKQMGKQAVHIGGPLQLYFGIKGKRWNNSGLYNEYWVKPDNSERPQNLNNVENGCYW